MTLKQFACIAGLPLLAIASHAAGTSQTTSGYSGIMPVMYECSKENVLGGSKPVFNCHITQLKSQDELAAAKAGGVGQVYDEWDMSFVNDLYSELDAQIGTGEIEGINVYFENDFEFGGTTATSSGDIECVDGNKFFRPLKIPAGTTDVSIKVDGKGNTVSNLCLIDNGWASFFAQLQNASVENIAFENAYIKAYQLNADQVTTAAVVTYSAKNVVFDNITITGSSVNAVNCAGGIVGDVSGTGTSQLSIMNSDVDVSVTGVKVGGLVGVLSNSPLASGSSVVLSDNTVKLKIDDGRADSSIYVGGLVGKIDLENSASGIVFEISKNSVTADVNEAELATSKQQRPYYLGGLVGYMMFNSNLLVSENTVTSKRMNVSRTVSADVYAGGLFGYVDYASNANGFTFEYEKNVVDVSMDIETKSSVMEYLGGLAGYYMGVADGETWFRNNQVKAVIASSNPDAYLVQMGGLVAALIEKNTNGGDNGLYLNSLGNELTLAMKAASTQAVRAGGLYGILRTKPGQDPYGVVITTSKVKAVDGKNLIETTASTVEEIRAGGIVGVVDNSTVSLNISQSHVQGDLEIAATKATDMTIGGVVGYAVVSDANIYGNVSEGNIRASTGDNGYVVGTLQTQAQSQSGMNLYANYHYGESDADVADAIGHFTVGNTNVTDWKTTEQVSGNSPYFIKYNYRNALKSLAADGSLNILGDGSIGKTGLHNGIIDGDEMKSRLFTYVLNNVNGPYSMASWDNEPGKLPVITGVLTAYKVSVDLSSVYSLLTSDDKSSLNDYLITENGVPYVVAYSEKDGTLPTDFVKKMNALSISFAPMDSWGGMVDLANRNFSNNETFGVQLDHKLKVVYEIEDPNQSGVYLSLDDQDPVYFWPKVENTSQFSSDIVPPVFMTFGGSRDVFEVANYYVTCSDNSKNCPSIQDYIGSEKTISQILATYQSKFDEHTDVLHLVYSNSYGGVPGVSVVTEKDTYSSFMLDAVSYGFGKDGKQTAADSLLEQGALKSELPLASRIAVRAGLGYRLKNWQADFWIADSRVVSGYDELEACYENSSSNYNSSKCYAYESMTAEGPYLAGKDTLYNEYMTKADRNGASTPKALKWTYKLDTEQVLDLDSVVAAFAPYQGLLQEILFHLHIIPEYETIPYKVTFDMNTDSKNVFFTDKFYRDSAYAVEPWERSEFPKAFRTDACFAGWTEKPLSVSPGTSVSTEKELNVSLLERLDVKGDSLKLYAAWTDSSDLNHCWGFYVTTLELDQEKAPSDKQFVNRGTVFLWQGDPNGGDKKFEHHFEKDIMYVPATDPDTITFHVASLPDSGYGLADAVLVTKDTYGSGSVEPLRVTFGNTDTTFTVAMMGGYEYALQIRFGRAVKLKLDLNTSNKDVFYGMNSITDSILSLVEGSGQVWLPKEIYTSDACVLGWSVKSDSKNYEYRDSASSDELFENLSKNYALYAVWDDADECVASANYNRARLVSEHGQIAFDENGNDSLRHTFASDSTMLLPHSMYGANLVLRSLPEPGYKLDSVVAVYKIRMPDGTYSPESKEVLHKGSKINDYLLNATFNAYFSEGEESDDNSVFNFVVHDFAQSGSAVRIVLETDQAAVDSAAAFQMALMDAQGKPLAGDTTISKLTERFKGSKIWCPLAPGKYTFVAKLSTARDTVSFDTSFTVSNEIAVRANEWHMLSLASVDMKKVVWDDDPMFYWWDESSLSGEYWQYRGLKANGSVDENVGYWYNSLEGRALSLSPEGENPNDQIVWKLDSLYTGWNLVANPYGWSVDIYGDSSNASGKVAFWKYDPKTGNYDPATEIGPYEGVWASVDHPMEWFVPGTPVFPKAEKDGKALHKAVLAKAADRNNWTIQAELSDGNGKVDVWNVLGAGEKPVSGLEPPEGMGDHVNLSIVDGKKMLAKSVREAVPEMEWTVALSASTNRTGYLSFAGVDALREFGLKVFVTVDGKTTEMHDGQLLKVGLTKSAKQATVRVAASARKTVAYTIGRLNSVQRNGMLQVSLDIGNGLAGTRLSLDLVDMQGHLVRTVSARATEGLNTLQMALPRSGVYVLRARAGGQAKTGKVLVK